MFKVDFWIRARPFEIYMYICSCSRNVSLLKIQVKLNFVYGFQGSWMSYGWVRLFTVLYNIQRGITCTFILSISDVLAYIYTLTRICFIR